ASCVRKGWIPGESYSASGYLFCQSPKGCCQRPELHRSDCAQFGRPGQQRQTDVQLGLQEFSAPVSLCLVPWRSQRQVSFSWWICHHKRLFWTSSCFRF